MNRKFWILIGSEAVVFAVLLFGAAGSLSWVAGWAFLVVFFTAALQMSYTLARHDPALLQERLRPIVQKDQPLWDKILMTGIGFGFLGWLILMALDAGRFHWSKVPVWVQVLGGIGVFVSMGICSQAMQENSFAVPVVKLQEERGQKVISTGPYAVVRHPMYSGALLLFPMMALLLGSWWGVAASSLLAAVLIIRTALEDRELQRGLEGYKDYARRVRARLVPFVW